MGNKSVNVNKRKLLACTAQINHILGILLLVLLPSVLLTSSLLRSFFYKPRNSNWGDEGTNLIELTALLEIKIII